MPMSTDLQDSQIYDVAIVGGGLAGLTMAVALGRSELSVVVIDREDPLEALSADYDGRSIAVAYASWQLFRTIGVWQHLEEDAQPMHDIMITDGKAPVFLKFERDTVGTDPFGQMVEMRHLRAGLAKAVATCDTVRLVTPKTVDHVEADIGLTTIALDDGQVLQARLAIAADGRNSPLREAAGITTTNVRYDQQAIVTTIEHELDHDGIAYEHFLPQGPFAILPLRGKRSSLVWPEKPAVAEAILALADNAFNQEIVKRMGDVLGTVKAVGPRFSYPLSLQLANSFHADRLALIGDAAHGIHPIAGQGINLGWRDVAALAEMIVDAHRLGMDIGADDLLLRYEKARRGDTLMMAAATHVLDRLFSNDIAPLRLARDVGLAVVNRLGPAKRFFINQARGAGGKNVPKLLRGEAL
jgi:2-octaprenyl-6-methoxyphenol hydroxylase